MRRCLLVAAIVAATVIPATPALGFAGAFFPTQSSGNRGADVAAIQYLLNQHGHTATVNSTFGSGTVNAVRAFQSARGLGVDGIVGPVASFQTHAGISADGIVGPITWRNLVWHYDYPDFSAGICDQDPDGNGIANWGTAAAIGQLEAAARSFTTTGQGTVPLGDIGFEHGGDIPGHASHEVGLDVDVWPIRTDSAQCTAGRITWRSTTYDRAATRQLVQAIRSAAPGHVRLIFFNDPVLIGESLTVSQANHDNHLHIRYCERVHPNSLYDC